VKQYPRALNVRIQRPVHVLPILNGIYKVDFKGFSYGFRPGRSESETLDALSVGLQWSLTRSIWFLGIETHKSVFFWCADQRWRVRLSSGLPIGRS
jgi:hypothetical protein